jgi:hypothetical protein
MKKSIYSIMFVSLMLLFIAVPAFADTTGWAVSKLNLDEFATKFNFGTTGDFTWSYSVTQTTSAMANGTPSSTLPTATVTDGVNYYASATSEQTSTLSLNSTSAAGPKASYLPSASSTYIIEGTYVYTGSGTTIDGFTVAATQALILKTDPGMTKADGNSLATFSLLSDNNDIALSFTDHIGPRYNANGSASINGLKTTNHPYLDGYTFANGDTGYLYIEASTWTKTSAVPIPAALWLLGSGLIGLVGIRRKLS